jgi:hypothetical protein
MGCIEIQTVFNKKSSGVLRKSQVKEADAGKV